jgi:sugar/nucleoside kinase (ribokinase family)
VAETFDIMVAGHVCLDVIPRFAGGGSKGITEIMRPGKLINVEDAKISTGGPVSNTGLNMRTLGNSVCFCARVGDDDFGQITVQRLRQSGNAEGIHVEEGSASSYTIVIAPPGVDRIFLHNPGTNNEFGPGDLDPELISRCRHFHFGYPPLMRRMYESGGGQLKEVFQIAKRAGATTSCDMTLPDPDSPSGKVDWLELLEGVLPFVDVFLPSIEELFYMFDPDAFLQMKRDHDDAELIDYLKPGVYSRVAERALALGTKMVSLKSGHRGFYLRTGSGERFAEMGAARPGDPENWSQRELWAPAFEVPNLASATGSGDSAIAGFLAAFLRGLTIEESLKYAVCCGWQNVQVLDAVSGIHPWDETTAMLEKNMPMIDVCVEEEGWTWSEAWGLWAGPEDPLSRVRPSSG